jgi:hypothetical protein
VRLLLRVPVGRRRRRTFSRLGRGGGAKDAITGATYL